MNSHLFLFSQGVWLGEGNISFSASPESLHFATKWFVDKKNKEGILCTQDVELQDSEEMIHNTFFLSDLKNGVFAIQLENELIGSVAGSGLIEKDRIAWEFRSHLNFQGYEIYNLQDNGEYTFHAEYFSPDQFRTIIDGRIWMKN